MADAGYWIRLPTVKDDQLVSSDRLPYQSHVLLINYFFESILNEILFVKFLQVRLRNMFTYASGVWTRATVAFQKQARELTPSA